MYSLSNFNRKDIKLHKQYISYLKKKHYEVRIKIDELILNSAKYLIHKNKQKNKDKLHSSKTIKIKSPKTNISRTKRLRIFYNIYKYILKKKS